MTVEAMRTAIISVYPGQTWRLRVQGMKDDQVIAIYKHMKEENIFEKAKKARKQKESMKEQGVQLTIWDFMIHPENKD